MLSSGCKGARMILQVGFYEPVRESSGDTSMAEEQERCERDTIQAAQHGLDADPASRLEARSAGAKLTHWGNLIGALRPQTP